MKENQNNNENQEQKKSGLSRFFVNTNNRWAAVLSIVLFVLITIIAVFGDVSKNKDNNIKPVSKTEQLNLKELQPCFLYDEAEFRANLLKLKDFGEIEITDSPVLGLKQVTVKSSGEVFYANSTGDIVIVGVMLNIKGENLTKQAMDKISQAKFQDIAKSIDKSLAVKVGNGKHELIAFTDPDCSYCRAAETMFKENADRLDVTKYIFFTPLDSIHPDAAAKTVHILCSANPAEELEKVMRNEITEFPNQCEEGKAKLAKHREIGAKLNVTGTPTFYVDGVRYVGANPEIIEKISKK